MSMSQPSAEPAGQLGARAGDVPAVEWSGVGYRYAGAESAALEDVTLRVLAGERLGILGPNGGGKSTLLKLTLGLLASQVGTVRVLGRSPTEARRAGLIGYVPQRPESELAMPMSVREMVTLGWSWKLAPWRRVPGEVKDRVERLLGLVGAAEFGDRAIGKLSGGQLQRVLIARALVAEPRILVLDEPMVGIDAPGQQKFAELLARVHRELGLTILIVSHDLRAIAAGTDQVACLSLIHI